MAIKAGDLAASAPGKVRTMISDGKRMRVMWEEGNGNGDPSASLVERTQSTMKGHPTWKVFCGEIPDPIVRGVSEPPRYVYLDDKACYTVWCSQLYTKQELRSFWPFDFDHVSKIRTGRKNRGRPAYLDDSHTAYATGTLRDKKKVYEFCGAPEFIGYTPEIHSSGVKAETKETEDEPTTGITIPKLITPLVPSLSFPLSPIGSPTANASSTHPSSTSQEYELGNGRIPWKHAESKGYIAGPADGSLLALGMAHKAMQGSPYFDVPAASYRSRPRPRGGDLAATLGILGIERKGKIGEEEKSGPTLPLRKKRKLIRPFASSSSDIEDSGTDERRGEVVHEKEEVELEGTVVESVERVLYR
ncbi:hypothetical protein CC86DRAFT_168803 [Ophiobolus disseminans]|uniref:Uncharacterized protein n=1 Tax=Ophiobolus disseminans TaxID=1469910 RepID=A0A6A7ACE8_9PLEO|nr:hypothetical protein CC86DRAFT_168803 [Ophiobolus disseminans]